MGLWDEAVTIMSEMSWSVPITQHLNVLTLSIHIMEGGVGTPRIEGTRFLGWLCSPGQGCGTIYVICPVSVEVAESASYISFPQATDLGLHILHNVNVNHDRLPL